MSRLDRAFLVACVVGILAMALVFILSGDDANWYEGASPEGVPVIGFWYIDGRVEADAVVRHGDTYYEYWPGHAVQALYSFQPMYWIDFPGRAE